MPPFCIQHGLGGLVCSRAIRIWPGLPIVLRRASQDCSEPSWVKATEAVEGKRALESQEGILPAERRAYLRGSSLLVPWHCSWIPRAKFQVEFKQIRLNVNQ